MKATLLLAALVAVPALAQTPPASIGQPFIPPPAPPALDKLADDVQVTLQPPLREQTAQGCVIYGLLPPG